MKSFIDSVYYTMKHCNYGNTLQYIKYIDELNKHTGKVRNMKCIFIYKVFDNHHCILLYDEKDDSFGFYFDNEYFTSLHKLRMFIYDVYGINDTINANLYVIQEMKFQYERMLYMFKKFGFNDITTDNYYGIIDEILDATMYKIDDNNYKIVLFNNEVIYCNVMMFSTAIRDMIMSKAYSFDY